MTTVDPASPPVDSGSAPDGPSGEFTSEVPADGQDPPPTPHKRRVQTLLLPGLVLLGLALVLALAPVAHLAARRLPLPPNDPTPIVAGATRPGTTAMRNVPVGLPASVTITGAQDVYPYAVAALGVLGAQELMAVLSSPDDLALYHGSTSPADFLYPYHYPALEPILDAAAEADLRRGATQLAAALIMLAGQPGLNSPAAYKAAPAAFGVLDRTRSSGGCDGQLDLLLLVAGDDFTTSRILADEQRRTVSACANEPTPDWIVGQAQMRDLQLTFTPRPSLTDEKTRRGLAAAISTFQALTERFPRDTAAVTGLGDAYLRAGLRLLYSEPFTARHDLRLAVAQYNQAAILGAGHDADLGRARALVGLGESKRAVPIASQIVATSPRPGSALEVLLTADEGAHDFAGAEAIARRLAQSGPAAYPTATAFYPAPRESDALGSVAEASRPLSMGAEALTPLQDTLVPAGRGAGGSVQDLSFIPQYRDDLDVTGPVTDCPSLAWRRDAILAGHAAEALEDWPDEFTGARPETQTSSCAVTNNLQAIAQLVAQRPITSTKATKDDLTDQWQNLLRWAGDLPTARKVITTWEIADGERSPLPALRLGEVAFLQHDYNEAAAQFDVAARRTRLVHYDNDLAVDQAQLNRGAALFAAGRNAEAIALLRPLVQLGTQGYSFQTTKRNIDGAASFAAVSYFAAEQLADYESASNDLHAAVDDYNTALSWTAKVNGLGVRPEVLYNNLALAELGLGATATAASLEAKALHSDPMDPAFLMTAWFIADRAGRIAEAADYDRRALQSDPGAFPAANDLGVELGRQHHDTAAVTALRQAIGADPTYALGWFNLGVLEGRLGPLHLPASQGAFAKAFALDPTLKDRRHDLTIDASVYRTALDLSKPLPPHWSLADTQKALPVATAGLLAALLLAVGLARSSSPGGTDLAKQWLEPVGARLDGVRGLTRLRHPLWAVVATVVTFLLAYLRHAGSPTDIVTYAFGVLVLTGTAMYARVAIAVRASVATTQRSWWPGMAFGLGTGAIGLPWAPLPVVKTSTESTRVHLAAPLTLAALSGVLFVESAWLGVPLTQSLAVVALVMAGSTLLPIRPLDGANVGKTGIAAAAGVVGGAVLIALGII